MNVILLLEDERAIADTLIYAFEAEEFVAIYHKTCGKFTTAPSCTAHRGRGQA